MLHGRKERTPSGNLRAPPMNEYLQWIVEAWEALPNELIKKSFKSCGIGNRIDGSEDHFINCFKSDGPIPEGAVLLKEARANEQLNSIIGNFNLMFSGEKDVEEASEEDSDASLELEPP